MRGTRFAGSPATRRGRAASSRKRNGCRSTSPRATRPEDWLACLAGIDAVVNCAGVLQDCRRDSTRGVHADGSARCSRPANAPASGGSSTCRRSASTARRRPRFRATKREGDEALMRRDLDWVILRPSVVLGPAAYGGSALFRGLGRAAGTAGDAGHRAAPGRAARRRGRDRAVLPHADAPRRGSRSTSPDRSACRSPRSSAGTGPGSAGASRACVAVPRWLGAVLYRLGDFAGWLGWRPPLRSTARREITRGAVGDPRPLDRADRDRAAIARGGAVPAAGLGAGALVRRALPAEAGRVRRASRCSGSSPACCRSGPGCEIGADLMQPGRRRRAEQAGGDRRRHPRHRDRLRDRMAAHDAGSACGPRSRSRCSTSWPAR